MRVLRDGMMEGWGERGETETTKNKNPKKNRGKQQKKMREKKFEGVYESKSFLFCFFFLLPH